jgi:hypothetical protein
MIRPAPAPSTENLTPKQQEPNPNTPKLPYPEWNTGLLPRNAQHLHPLLKIGKNVNAKNDFHVYVCLVSSDLIPNRILCSHLYSQAAAGAIKSRPVRTFRKVGSPDGDQVIKKKS